MLEISAELFLLLITFIQNATRRFFKQIEGKSIDEIREIAKAYEDETNLLIAEMHSTDT